VLFIRIAWFQCGSTSLGGIQTFSLIRSVTGDIVTFFDLFDTTMSFELVIG
jgi:hypothetical protein